MPSPMAAHRHAPCPPVAALSASPCPPPTLPLAPCPAAAAHWVKAPAVLLLHHNGRGFELELDPTGLPEGLHYTGGRGRLCVCC